MAAEQSEKVRENRLRRAAERQGLQLVKIRRRDPRAIDFGMYRLFDMDTGNMVEGEDVRLTLDEVERLLLGGGLDEETLEFNRRAARHTADLIRRREGWPADAEIERKS